MSLKFIFFVALRYFKARRQNRRIASSLLSISGISVGVMTLITVLAVMNGFQLSFIEPILEIKSYHLQLTPQPQTAAAIRSGARQNPEGKLLERLDALKSVKAVVPFYDLQTVAESSRPCFLRAVPLDLIDRDQGFVNSFHADFGLPNAENLDEPGSIVLGSQLARHLYLSVGDKITLVFFSEHAFSNLKPVTYDLTVTEVFKTGYYEVDMEWAFISLDTARLFTRTSNIPLTYGIKLTDNTRDREAVAGINEILAGTGYQDDYTVASWREFNQAFFNALKTEKMMMMILIQLIFVVVGFNIFHSLRRTVYERLDEIGTLKALGASTGAIQSVFILEGFITGFLGCVIGFTLGLTITNNINSLFRAIESMCNDYLIPLLTTALTPFWKDVALPPVYIFSPQVFYIEEVPTRVFFGEAFLIALFAILCSCLAALFASRYVSKIKPGELMRYE